ncbi:SPFH domain-containing protein [Myxococcaceae bacterium JPH2]|nr:SPFH domain-containing protein [Myxococcaceae bacterium JPH2]
MSANVKQQSRSTGSDGDGMGRPQLARVEGGGLSERPRYTDGWRAGKPAEDPDKVKRWGLVTARPSEFLIHMRRGRVREVSGQGASCFKWPGDSVAIVPTSIQRLQFTADQVTSEKVGVQVTGLAVYRIADPLVAFRMLNFSYPERAQEKLAELLREMFVGAARRLVANLTVEECLSRRKEGIAAELVREIAPVLSGHGRVEDRTDTGWGVLLDTIEIQDVRVLSSTVFENMQARYRREQERQAREAELAKERFVRREETEAERQWNLQRLAAQDEVRQRKQATEEQAKLEQLAVEARVAEAKLAQDRKAQQEQTEVERELAIAKLAAQDEVRQRKQAADEKAKLELLAAEARMVEAKVASERHLAVGRAQVEMEKLEREQETEAARARMAVERVEREKAAEGARAKLELEKLRLAKEAEGGKAEIELEKLRLAKEAEGAKSQIELEKLRLAQETEAAKAQMELERLQREQEAQNALALMALERMRREQEQMAARHEGLLAESLQEAERLKAQLQVMQAKQAIAEAETAITELEVRKTRAQHELELSRARALRDIENTVSPEVIQMTLARQLPQVAAAFQQKMGEVHVTAVDGANPFGYIAAAVEGVMGLARSAGLKVPAPSAASPAQ